MNKALKIVLGLEVALGLLWTVLAAMAHGPGGLGALAIGLVIYAIFAAFFVFAAWALWKHPDERKLAGWIMVLPVVFFFTPFIVRSMAGEYLTSDQFNGFLLFAAIAAIGACWVLPKKVVMVIPGFLIRSKLFNWLVILAIAAGWLFLIFVVIYITNEDISSTSGTGLGAALIIGALYLIGLGVANFVAATWAWVCLRGGTDGNPRGLNITQLVVAAPAILIGLVITGWSAIQGQL